MVDNFLATDPKVLRKYVVLGQSGQIAVFVGGVDPFVDGMVISQMLDDLLDEFLVLDEVATAQMVNARFVPIDEVMDLLCKPIVVGHVDNQIGKYLYGFLVLDVFLDFLDSWRGVAKDHRNPQNSCFFLGQPHHHVLDFYFETTINT